MADAPADVDAVEVAVLEPTANAPAGAVAASADGGTEVAAMLEADGGTNPATEGDTAKGIMSTSAGTHAGAFGAAEWALFWSIGLIWGSSFLLMAVGLESFHPGLITWIRVGSGAAILTLVPAARKPIEREDQPRLLALSFMWVAVPFTIFPIAQQWISSAVTGMLNGAVPIFAATIASVMLKKLPRGAQLAGLAVGFAGVVLVCLPSVGEGDTQALGVVLVLCATICYGFSVNIAAPIQQKYGSLPVMCVAPPASANSVGVL